MAHCELCGGLAEVEKIELGKHTIEACATCKRTLDELRRKEHAAKVYDTQCIFEV